MMTMNKNIITTLIVIVHVMLANIGAAALTNSQRDVGIRLIAEQGEQFCGNSPGRDGVLALERYGIDSRTAGLIFVDIVDECLRVPLPRPAETNKLCTSALVGLWRFGIPEAVPIARRAFMDPSDKFNFDAMLVYFDCETNVQAIADFTEVVWTNTLGDASTKRLDYAISMKDWLRANRDLTGMQKSVLYDRFVACAQAESEAYVALRLDPILQLLNRDYESSEARTNLVIRFKDNTSALMDPLYFRRLADSMGIQ